jgi:hypothetical protein
MLQAYVGLASVQGLRTFQMERPDSLDFVRRSAIRFGNKPCVGFWAVVSDADAHVVQSLLQDGDLKNAMRHLDLSALDLGRLSLHTD